MSRSAAKNAQSALALSDLASLGHLSQRERQVPFDKLKAPRSTRTGGILYDMELLLLGQVVVDGSVLDHSVMNQSLSSLMRMNCISWLLLVS